MPPRKSKAAKSKKTSKVPKDEIVEVEEVSPSQLIIKDTVIEKAVKALSQWNKSQSSSSAKKDLFETDDDDLPLFLQVTSNKFFAQNNILKPRMLEIPHPIYDLEDVKVCIFVKDDLFDEESLQRIELLKDDELKNLNQIVTVKELKTKYHQYEARRKLLSEFDMFLTDSSIANMIPKLLGKTFFGSSKLPLTISITEKKKLSVEKLTRNFKKALNSVGYVLPMGTNTSFKLGMLGQDLKALKENIYAIAKYLEQFPIRFIQLKLNGSPALPIFIAKKIYTDEDIISSEEESKKHSEDNEIPLSIYVEGLRELGLDEEEATSLFGAKKRVAEPAEVEVKSPASKKSKKSQD